MRRIAVTLGLVFCSAFLAAVSPAASGGGNPHLGISCTECHAKIPAKGKTASAEVLAGLKKGPVELCRDCHPESEVSHHPVVKKTERALPEGLPLSAAGEVICSTCHDIHRKEPASYLLRGFGTGRYAVRMDLCLDCHGESFAAINPHNAGPESEKCRTCHVGKPGAADDSGTVKMRENLGKICDFCHDVRTKAHPGNVDTMKRLPEGLPRGKGGEVICGTCHDPHGTPDTIHFLRSKYVEALERGRYANPHGRSDYASCQGCHLEVRLKKEEMRTNLRYGGDDMRICHSCHGAMDACHPVLINLPDTMKPGKDLPLTPDGKIKCLTCHDPMAEGSGVAVRRKEKGEPVNALCFRCHDKADLSSRNPHATMSDRETCRFCHDTMTDPTNEEAGRVSFISNTRLICLRCHAQENHPMGVNHMVAPKGEVPEPFKLDGRGRLTCTTCHNPHIDVKGNGGRSHRFVVAGEGSALCSRCHRR
ncbi:MAG TPA: cytochrome c3 family protein [Thermodesulfobacteriota bacterium]|nr:cytochrome c3 family protein [Thermodesulfobacteriota bacterium]